MHTPETISPCEKLTCATGLLSQRLYEGMLVRCKPNFCVGHRLTCYVNSHLGSVLKV